jgi:UDP:flavonoid glycosyltransferase YjiC (YdhE family)
MATSGARIVFTTWGSLGDLHPFLALAIELKRRGHDPVVATLPAWRENVERAGIGFRRLRPDISPATPDARDIVRRILDPREGTEFLFKEILGPALRETYDDTMAAVTGDRRADLLVSHQIPMVSPIVAAKTGVKWISGLLAPAGFLSAYDPPSPPPLPKLRPLIAFHPALGRAFLQLARQMSKPWAEPVYRLRAELGLDRGPNPIFEGQHSPTRVLALFSDVMATAQPDYPPRTVITGFPFYDAASSSPDPDLLRFLDAGDPPIVFTLGSSAVWVAKDFFAISVEAVRRIGRRGLLLVGENAAALRETLPVGIGAFDYAPHSLVMPRASVIVHQGGIGTTAQALRAGRPTLIVPFGQDQPDNARRTVGLGVGRTITRAQYSVDRVSRELSALLTDASYASRAARVADLVRGERGTATACDAIEQAIAGV